MTDTAKLNRPSPSTLDLLLSRRSGSAKTMGEPGPTPSELALILKAAARVPDHGKLFPWRFIVFEGEARARMGEVLVAALDENERASPERIEQERTRFLRAPTVVAVVSKVREMIAIPVWEQQLSAGAVCQTLLIAAHSLGYAGNWLTEWCAYRPAVKDALGLHSGERIAGFLYLGTPTQTLQERVRPDMDLLVTKF
ncbi:MAG: nitroreductase [Alphaproteobacteria bacterium]|nr:nitroreductase [Alphaproteobacteria bacterium]